MSVFLLDLWHDLRDKRLAPVAVVLAVAIVVVPMVLLKPGSEGGEPAQVAAPATEAASLPTVQAVDGGPSKVSDLGLFDPKDPFEPKKSDKGSDGSQDGVAELVGTSQASTPTVSSGSAPDDSAVPPTGEFLTKLDDNSGSGGDGSSGQQQDSRGDKPATTTYYTYVIDARFGARGAERKHKGVRRLDILPNADNPLLVFLGVSGDRKKAVFLADSSASQAGEGTCKPNVETCTFIYLSLDEQKDEHFLTDEAGQEYVLKLLDIRRVKVAAKKSARASGTDPLFADDARR